MKYDIVYQFTKKGNLLDYFHSKADEMKIATAEQYDRLHERYAQEREINLYAMLRYDDIRPVVYCKIKCPVNPLPINGEFELVSERIFCQFLESNGWTFKQKIILKMFK